MCVYITHCIHILNHCNDLALNGSLIGNNTFCIFFVLHRVYTYQSTDAIRKRHIYIHISGLMQSENGTLLLFCIFLSHGNIKKNKTLCTFWKRGVGCKKREAVSCPQAPVISWRSVWLVDKTTAFPQVTDTHHIKLNRVRLTGFEFTTVVMLGTDCRGCCKSCKSNCHTMTKGPTPPVESTAYETVSHFQYETFIFLPNFSSLIVGDCI